MRFTIKTLNLDETLKQFGRQKKQAEKALIATGRDMKSRVPGWAADEVRNVYNIQKKEITPKKGGKPKKMAGKIYVGGTTVSSVTIAYEGRTLTPTHFGMRPKALTGGKGKRKKRKPITAEIKKGQRKSLGPTVFLGSNRGGGYIPFKRTGAKRYPIESVKTLSLPQMIDNPDVRENINTKINTELGKRLEHNIRRFIK